MLTQISELQDLKECLEKNVIPSAKPIAVADIGGYGLPQGDIYLTDCSTDIDLGLVRLPLLDLLFCLLETNGFN